MLTKRARLTRAKLPRTQARKPSELSDIALVLKPKWNFVSDYNRYNFSFISIPETARTVIFDQLQQFTTISRVVFTWSVGDVEQFGGRKRRRFRRRQGRAQLLK